MCQSLQEQLLEGGFVFHYRGTGSQKGRGLVLPGLLQPVVSGSKIKQQVEAHPGSEHPEIVSPNRILQDGNPRDHKILPSTWRVGHFLVLPWILIFTSQ